MLLPQPTPQPILTAALALAAATAAVDTGVLMAQEPGRAGAVVTGRILDGDGAPVAVAAVAVEGTRLIVLSDSAGAYLLRGVPPGPQLLIVDRLGYATARIPLSVPLTGTMVRDIRLATQPLELEGLIVTADPSGRARGELGTASVIDREAIENQTATSLAGVLELVPGVPLSPPGLEGIEQIALRTVPVGSSTSLTQGGPSAGELAAFGTLIILDGVPLSNNANLQSTGPRGELPVPSSARGGVDLRAIPASTIERVEVIRGVPSARFGDLTQGAIIVDTRAGRIEPTLQGRYSSRLAEGSAQMGGPLQQANTVSGTLDLTHSEIAPGVRDDDVQRITTQLAHRYELRRPEDVQPAPPRLLLDSRVDFFRVNSVNPERPEVQPGRASANRDWGLRVSERARLNMASGASLSLTSALDYTRRSSFVQAARIRGAMPLTDRLTEGRSVGRFVLGEYLSRVDLEGREWNLFNRLEWQQGGDWLRLNHDLRAGLTLRRAWNTGAGYIFDVEFPQQTSFNGVRGFDRPRRFDAIPPVATTGVYLDDRFLAILPGRIGLDAQAGLRLDLLHDGTTWLSGVRDAVLQPRLNLQLTPWQWLRLRGGWGLMAKQPSLDALSPAPQYFDLVNVNYFTPDPDERLAVLTTFIRDPANPGLGFSRARRAETGVEIAPPGLDLNIGVTLFDDRLSDGVGLSSDPSFLLRERFQLTDSVVGNGIPPEIIEPAFQVDTVPILVDRPANNLVLESRGIELEAALPEIRPLRTRIHVQGAWIESEFLRQGLDFGSQFNDFQLNEEIPRAPFWEDAVRKGETALVTYRVIQHQPAIGLVVTATLEHIAHDRTEIVAATDTLAFAGYITRSGRIVRVPRARRSDPEFADLRVGRLGTIPGEFETPADWLLSLQVAKTLPGGGRVSFYAFNVLDRIGRFSESGFGNRLLPGLRFGVEANLPVAALF